MTEAASLHEQTYDPYLKVEARPIELELDLQQVDYLLDFLANYGEDDPYLQEMLHSIHEQTYL